MRTVLDPTGERQAPGRAPLPRLNTLAGAPSACSTSSKPRGDVVLDRLEQLLTADGAHVRRYRKPTFARTAPVDLRHEIAEQCEVVIEALAD